MDETQKALENIAEQAKSEVKDVIGELHKRIFNGSIPETALNKVLDDIQSIYEKLYL